MSVPFVLPWLVFALTWLALGPVAVALHAIARPALLHVESRQRSVLLLALAVLPCAVAALVAALGFAPKIGGLVVEAHCHAGQGCGPHVPTLHASLIVAAGVGGAVALISFALCWRFTERLRRSLALAGTLSSFASLESRDEPFRTVDSAAPFACCVGLLRPRVLLSRGLLTRLTPGQRTAVVAHERTHARRCDNLRQWLASASLALVPRRWRKTLLHDLASAAEEICDGAATREAGTGNLAGALRALDVRAESIEARLAASTIAAAPLPGTGVLALIVLAYTLCALPLLDAAHYLAESLLATAFT